MGLAAVRPKALQLDELAGLGGFLDGVETVSYTHLTLPTSQSV